jgi:hypothetical protein
MVVVVVVVVVVVAYIEAWCELHEQDSNLIEYRPICRSCLELAQYKPMYR